MKTYRKILSIAGSDSGGAAGIQADIKTISACGGYAMTAITAVTAQNSCGVTAIHPVPLSVVESQIRAVLEDLGADAVKIGMLHSSEIIRLVANLLKEYRLHTVVVDPVMVTASGDKLLQEEAIQALRTELFPLATVITPNLFEARLLSGQQIRTQEDVYQAVRNIAVSAQCPVLLKAGHLETDLFFDVLYDPRHQQEYRYPTAKVYTLNTNGTGCSFGSAIATFLAKEYALPEAVEKAHRYLHQAIVEGARYTNGKGHGNIHHFHAWWE